MNYFGTFLVEQRNVKLQKTTLLKEDSVSTVLGSQKAWKHTPHPELPQKFVLLATKLKGNSLGN